MIQRHFTSNPHLEIVELPYELYLAASSYSSWMDVEEYEIESRIIDLFREDLYFSVDSLDSWSNIFLKFTPNHPNLIISCVETNEVYFPSSVIGTFITIDSPNQFKRAINPNKVKELFFDLIGKTNLIYSKIPQNPQFN